MFGFSSILDIGLAEDCMTMKDRLVDGKVL